MGRAIPSLAALTAAAILSTAGTPARAQTLCSSTDTAVTAVNPTDAAALAADCAALLGAKDTLRGTATLNWANTLSMASWDGVALASDMNRVTDLLFPNVGLNGTIPDLSALTGLGKLTLTTGLTGSIVAAHFPTSLEHLEIGSNKFTGSIPDLSGLTNLTLLNAVGSGLTGSLDGTPFPASLQYLRLGSNELTGSIPDLSGLTNLLDLQLEDNEFDGGIPDLSAATSLRSVQLQHNKLTGSIGGANFPASLTSLLLSNNELTGSIPDLSALTSLETLHLQNNKLTRSITAAHFPASLTRLLLRDNGLTGSIPDLSALTSLEWLLVDDNNLTGSIPDLSALTSLEFLYLHRNSLTGSIVATQFPTSLTRLILGGNGLTGGIPSGLDALTSLELLALCGNELTDSATLPAALETQRSGGSLTVFGYLRIADAAGVEGTTLSFDVTWSTWPVRGDNSWTLDYETENGTATSADYTATGSVTVPAIGSSETEVTAKLGVALKADNLVEGDETFTVTLAPSGRAVLQLGLTAQGTIRDAAPPPPAPGPSPDPPSTAEPPTGGTVGGASVTLDFGQSLDTSSVPDASDFTVTSTPPSAASASSAPNEPASVAAAQTVNHTVTAVQIQGVSVLLTVSPRIPAGASVRVSYTKGAKPLRTEAGAEIDSFGVTVSEPDPGPPVPPTAAFTVDAPCADGLCRARTGEAVAFTDTSSGDVSRRSWDFYVPAGRAPSGAVVRHAWSSPGFYEVTLTVSGAGAESTASRVFLVEAANPAGTCEPDGETICLQDSRYQVRATWRGPEGEAQPARVAHAGTNDSGLFSFFDRDNWEALVKVLDGCAINGADWVFAASATTLGLEIAITDTVTGEVRRYGNEPGRQADAVTDTGAFTDRCANGGTRAAGSTVTGAGDHGSEGPVAVAAGHGASSSLLLNEARFEVAVEWWTADGRLGEARSARAGTEDSGLFWFFGPDNWEMLIKVLDGCGFNGHYWVYAASATDVGLDITVTDTVTGEARQYTKDPGAPAPAITDAAAFPGSCRPD